MEIAQYAFQSPYPQQVQIGKRESVAEGGRAQDESAKLAKESNDMVRDTAVTAAQQQQERDTVLGGRLLDLYA